MEWLHPSLSFVRILRAHINKAGSERDVRAAQSSVLGLSCPVRAWGAAERWGLCSAASLMLCCQPDVRPHSAPSFPFLLAYLLLLEGIAAVMHLLEGLLEKSGLSAEGHLFSTSCKCAVCPEAENILCAAVSCSHHRSEELCSTAASLFGPEWSLDRSY